MECAAAALCKYLASLNYRGAARTTRALAILKNRCQACGPFLRAIRGGERDHGFLPAAIFEMEYGAVGDDRRRQSFARFDLPNDSRLTRQLGQGQALGWQDAVAGWAAPLLPIDCLGLGRLAKQGDD